MERKTMNRLTGVLRPQLRLQSLMGIVKTSKKNSCKSINHFQNFIIALLTAPVKVSKSMQHNK